MLKLWGRVIIITFLHYAQGYVLDHFVNSVVKCGLFSGLYEIAVVAPRGPRKKRTSISVQFLSFPCSFRQKFY